MSNRRQLRQAQKQNKKQKQPLEVDIQELITLFTQGKYFQALPLTQRMTENFPMYGFGWKILGSILKMLDKNEEALTAMQKALKLIPNDAEINNTIGIILLDIGRAQEAELFCQNAVKLKPAYAGAYNSLANILKDLGKLDEAEVYYRKTIELEPSFAEAYANLGNIARKLGKLDEAKLFYHKAIELNPNFIEVYRSLAYLSNIINEPKQAESCYRKVLELKPDFVQVHNDLGNLLEKMERFDEAKLSYLKAIELKPDYAQSYNNLANVQQALGNLSEVELLYRKAIEFGPNIAEPYVNLGTLLKNFGRLTEAENCFLKAIELKPNYAVAYLYFGNTLREQGRLYEAEVSYLKAIKLEPDNPIPYNNLGGVSKELGKFSEAETNYIKALELKPDYVSACSSLLGTLNYNPKLNVSYYLQWAKKFNDLINSKRICKFETYKSPPTGGKIRVGLVSGDFKSHPVGYIIESFLPYVQNVEFIAYNANYKEDGLTARIKPYFAKWSSIVFKSDKEAAEMVYADNIDILIDLSGHTAKNRLEMFAYRPAPIQASWLGYFASTGLTEIDYFIGDNYVMPANEEKNFVEKLCKLPDTWLCFIPPKDVPDVGSLPALANKFITFGCFGNLSKLNDEVLALYSEVLLKIPSSKLFLKAHQLDDAIVLNSLLEKFNSHGIESERLIFEGRSSIGEYFASYNNIDIVLDSFPYHGGTTSVDALYMGVPVLTLKGDRFLSRIGESIMYNIQMSEWIAQDKEAFVDKAIYFSSAIETLMEIRRTLRAEALKSPLYDGQKFAKAFEDAIRRMLNKEI